MSRLSAWWAQWPDSTVEKLYSWLPFVVFGLLAAFFYWPYLHWFPQGIHEWAQSDRLALAYGFYDRGFDFFHPRTLTLRTIDGVVGVEFPLQAYLVALLGLVVGRGQLSITFRVLDLVMMTVGCSYLFRLIFESTRSVGTALIPGAFLLSAPLFIYYSGNYLPDPFGISLLFVAFYYLYHFYYRSRQFSDLSLGLALVTLATLIKLSVALYMGPLFLILFVVSYLKPAFLTTRQKALFLGQMLVSFLAVGGWVLYMRWLNEQYASWIFLATVKPLKNKEESDWVIRMIEQYVVDEYLTVTAYRVLFACLALLLIYALVRWRQARRFVVYAALLLVVVAGIGPFYVLMGTQFAVHDYYSLAPVLPLLMLLVLGGLIALVRLLGNRWWLQLLSAVVAGALVVDGYQHFDKRIHDNVASTYRYHWAVDGGTWLNQAGVPTSARILVIGRDDAPNLSLSHFQRAGIVVSDSASVLESNAMREVMATNHLEYVVMRADMFRQMQATNTLFLQAFKTLTADERRILLVPQEALRAW